MTQQQFNLGDVVNLKSSKAPAMTIEAQNQDGTYKCVWIDLNKNPKTANYAGVVLEKHVSSTGIYVLGRTRNYRF